MRRAAGGKAIRIAPGVMRLLIVILLFAVWEAAARWYVDPMFLSAPSVVIASLPKMLAHPGVWHALGLLLAELATAFVLSLVVGVALGLAIGLGNFSRRTFMPIVILIYATPQITILPIVILLVGIGPASKIVFGVTHGMFPILVTVAASLRNIDPVLQRSARSMGANPWQRFRWVLLPHMVPSFFTGMRLAMTACLLGVLLAELYASSLGIGHFTREFTDAFDSASLFGLVTLVAIMAIILNELMRRAERHFSRWRAL